MTNQKTMKVTLFKHIRGRFNDPVQMDLKHFTVIATKELQYLFNMSIRTIIFFPLNHDS